MPPRITIGTSMVRVGESAIIAKIKGSENETVARRIQMMIPESNLLVLQILARTSNPIETGGDLVMAIPNITRIALLARMGILIEIGVGAKTVLPRRIDMLLEEGKPIRLQGRRQHGEKVERNTVPIIGQAPVDVFHMNVMHHLCQPLLLMNSPQFVLCTPRTVGTSPQGTNVVEVTLLVKLMVPPSRTWMRP
mmetsp:Transcript_24137/g.43535  ORF Transcript_24137/g.43535 Transcript_24137/m.43535 type:complete len:193 (-) Transcript_24137:639-1217(-)